MTNLNSEQINQARTLLEDAKSILIALASNPSVDTVSSGLALYLSLSAAGKQVSISSPTQMTVAFNNLVGVDKISTSVNGGSGRNLVISFPYQEGSIEKVSYNIEQDTFNLVIEPREEYPTITPDMMKYSHNEGNVDVIITIGTAKLSDLEGLYSSNQNLFSEKPVINIDCQSNNSQYGKVNIIDSSSSSISELMISLLSNFGLNIVSDIATNLLAGIVDETNNFSSNSTNAASFEAAAICLKKGAKRQKSDIKTPSFRPVTKQPFIQKQPAQKPATIPFGKRSQTSSDKPQMQPQQRSQPFSQKPKNQNQEQKPQPQATPPIRENKSPETPPDWLKPKIYKGSTLL